MNRTATTLNIRELRSARRAIPGSNETVRFMATRRCSALASKARDCRQCASSKFNSMAWDSGVYESQFVGRAAGEQLWRSSNAVSAALKVSIAAAKSSARTAGQVMASCGQPCSPSIHTQCSLTRRSSGAPTAGRQGPGCATQAIFTARALASSRCLPLSSNVRLHKLHRALRHQSQRFTP